VSSKCTAAAETQRAIIRLANPGTTLGSKASVGSRRRIAATIAGPEAYPPTPITTSGSNSKHPGRSRNRPRQIKHRLRPSHQADIFQRPNLNQFQREPGLRHQPRLNPTSRPDKKYLGAELLLKLLSNSQCRNNVSARPAARDNNAHEIVFPEGTLADCGENRVSYLGYRFSDTVSSSKSA